jgi:purine-binding chemotaxis protein CheW
MPLTFCTFEVSDLLVGVEIGRVQEVLHEVRTTEVPLAHPDVQGLINLRGQIVTAIEARGRLGLTQRESGAEHAHVIIKSNGEAVGLVVDNEAEVVDVDETSFEETPATLSDAIRIQLSGVYKLDDGLLLALDADRILDVVASSEGER